MFKKKNIEEGMVIETRDGKRYVYTNAAFRGEDSYVYLSEYDKNLKPVNKNKDFEVVRIYIHIAPWTINDVFYDDNLLVCWEEGGKKSETTDMIKLNNDWSPISKCGFPDELRIVEITYLTGSLRHCGTAYYSDGRWFWSREKTEIKEKVTAWRYITAYCGN